MTPEQVKELVERLLVPIDVGMVRIEPTVAAREAASALTLLAQERDAANERAMTVFEAKNHWAERARDAEKERAELMGALLAAEKADTIHSKCTECMEYGQAAEACGDCFPSADDARVMRRNVLAKIKKAARGHRHEVL